MAVISGGGASVDARRAMIFIDGENLSIRHERMSREPDRRQHENAQVTAGKFLWQPNLSSLWFLDVVRISYYTSMVGTHDALAELEDSIASIEWSCKSRTGQVIPRVFKKEKSGEKTKSVDINIAIDVLAAFLCQ